MHWGGNPAPSVCRVLEPLGLVDQVLDVQIARVRLEDAHTHETGGETLQCMSDQHLQELEIVGKVA